MVMHLYKNAKIKVDAKELERLRKLVEETARRDAETKNGKTTLIREKA